MASKPEMEAGASGVRGLPAATAAVGMQGATVRVEEAAGSGRFRRDLCRGRDDERRNAEAGSGAASSSSRSLLSEQ
jgi:hypothetical protein